MSTSSDSPTMNTLGFLGAGQMASALASGFVASGMVEASQIIASDPFEASRKRFADRTGAETVTDNETVLAKANVIVLAVKPQVLPELLPSIAAHVTEQHLIVSIAAGVPLVKLEQGLMREGQSPRRIVRVMPNTPSLVGQGASGFAGNSATTADDSSLVKRLLETVGVAYEVPEHLLDAVTGVSGSGPAYVYQMIEALSDGGVRMGLPRPIATGLAAQTLKGAAEMVLQTGEHPGALKDAVTSPGGTTIAALHELERSGLRAALMNAVEAATLRAKELGTDGKTPQG